MIAKTYMVDGIDVWIVLASNWQRVGELQRSGDQSECVLAEIRKRLKLQNYFSYGEQNYGRDLKVVRIILAMNKVTGVNHG